MTSVLRRYAQIDQRSRNLVVLGLSCPGYQYSPTSNIVSSPVMTISDFASAYPTVVQYQTGEILKDLGRAIHVYDPDHSNNLAQIYAQVMQISNATQEGISSKIAYVCSWSADGVSQGLLARVGQ